MLPTPPTMLKALAYLYYLDPYKWAQLIYNISYSHKKISRQNLICSGSWLLLLLILSWCLVILNFVFGDDCPFWIFPVVSLVIFGFVSCSPGAKEFGHEFSSFANSRVSLFTWVVYGRGEAILFSLSLGRWYVWIQVTWHVGKEYLGMKWVLENTLRRWEPLGGFGISSLNFLSKYVCLLYTSDAADE